MSRFAEFPFYDNARYKVISMPGLVKDAVIEVEYQLIYSVSESGFVYYYRLCDFDPKK
jgi:hypothetical protein